MFNIFPFKAIRPCPQNASVFLKDQIDKTPQRRKGKLKLDFLGLIQPQSNDGVAIKKRLKKFINKKILVQDSEKSIYIYKVIHPKSTINGIVGLVDTKKIITKKVKPHEGVLDQVVKTFSSFLKTAEINTEPVVLAYDNNKELDQRINEIQRSKPHYHFTHADSVHKLWRINHPTLLNQIQTLSKKNDILYLMDGHHRCASSANLTRLDTALENYRYCLSFIVPSDQLYFDSFYRLFKDLNGTRVDYFLASLSESFVVNGMKNYSLPTSSKQFNLFINKKWYRLIHKTKEAKVISSQTIYDSIAKQLLDITDLRTDPRIEYGYDNDPKQAVENAVLSKKVALGIIHYPIKFATIKEVCDQDLLLPPKSTCIIPKPLNGLLIYNFEDVNN